VKERPEDQHEPLRPVDPGVVVENGSARPEARHLAVPALVRRQRQAGEGQAPEGRQHDDARRQRRFGPPVQGVDGATIALAAAAYAAALLAQLLTFGVSLTPDRYVLVLLAPTLVLGCGRRFVLDFIPFVALVVLYEECRGLAHTFHASPYYLPQLDAEKWLFGGHVPSNVLQDWLWKGRLEWYDQVLSSVTRIHFIVPPTLAFALWLRRRALFYRFAASLLVLSYAGALTFYLFPAAPPWAAALHGLIPPLSSPAGVQAAASPLPTDSGPIYHLVDDNPYAAIPSLHAGYSVLIFLFVVTLARGTRFQRWAWLAILYPAVQWFAVVYTGGHYVVDLIIGAAYAAAAAFGVHLLWRRLGWPE
jgi:membrane-associated phospholipid phosphatase